MKIPVCLCHALLGCVIAATRAFAVDPDAENPYAKFDPDGVPLSVTQGFHPVSVDGSQNQKASLQQQNRDWLMRMYQTQQQRDKGSDTAEVSSFLRESNDREMARLAGLPATDVSKLSYAAYKTGTADSTAKNVSLRPSPDSSHQAIKPVDLSKPFITGFATPSAVTPYSAPPPLGGTLLFGGSNGTRPTSGTVKPKTSNATDLQTPGAVSAQDTVAEDKANFELRMDALPGESPDQAKQHQPDYGKLELSLPQTADQLHQDQKVKTSPKPIPGAQTAKTDSKQDQPQQVKPDEPDPNAPMQVNQVAPISPVRAPIANPFDILNR